MSSGGLTPEKGTNGQVVVNWTGSLADLMAADAYMDCDYNWQPGFDASNEDTYLRYLQSKMTQNETCNAACSSNSCDWASYWRTLRTTPACNYNTSNQAEQTLTWDTRNVSAYQPLGAPGAISSGTIAGKAQIRAATQLGIAEENLCMAQKLREEMVTAPSLLLQEADARELLGVIRERSQLAVLQYSLLSAAFTSPSTSTPTYTATVDAYKYLPLLRAFGNAASGATNMTQIGRDFAAAIELHSQITQELATDLARNASARVAWWPSAPTAQPALDWSQGSWRERILRLLYGGDPLGSTVTGAGEPDDAVWQVYPGLASPSVPTSYVSEDSRDPYVDELMTLARTADALYFFASDVVPDGTYQTSAVQLYRTVEASLETPACTTPSASVPSCAADAWGASIPDPTTSAITSTKLYQRGITLAHAESLLTRLGQAIPTGWTRTFCGGTRTGCTTSFSESEGAMHFTGPQTYLSAASATTALPGATAGAWYKLAANTVAIAPSMVERGSKYLTSFYLPMTLDVLNVGTTQGFVGA